ncbi:2-oxoglutarate-dependent dioxygenase DAO-like [Silene latifolia]|uniref:2-oxoglutarate-dependent dioxygenase DAO-like n=1 Tax=Silene latifolia TaxID=37657 RepID=UPI003D778AAF
MERQIPVIDYQTIHENLAKLSEVARTWGCFRLVNHGVSTTLMADWKSMSKALFQRPIEIKKKIKEVIPRSGYRTSNAKNPNYEAFAFYNVNNSQVLSTFSSDLQLSAQQREIMEMYTEATSKLASDVANKLAISIGLANYTFEDLDWRFEVRINKYTTTPETIGSCGVQLHTDDSFLTILQDDECFGGLQAMDRFGTFVDIHPLPNTFLVIFGDTAEAWSNGELRNAQHRVTCKDTGLRFSTATFMEPSMDAIIQPHPIFLQGGQPPRYDPFTYKTLRIAGGDEKLRKQLGLKDWEFGSQM